MTFEGRPDGQGGGDDGESGGRVDSVWNIPGIAWAAIPHYYGDASRQLLLGAAALMLIASPLYGDNLRIEFPFEVLGAFLAVGLAALTNPRDRWASMGDAVLSGVGMVTYATWGIFEYDSISPIAFVLRLVIALLFLFAFYFSMKTVRSFALSQIGRRETMDEFDDTAEAGEDEPVFVQNTHNSPPFNSFARFKPESERKRPVPDEGDSHEETRRARISDERKRDDEAAQNIADGRA
ncbi:MAG: hypothetical protein Q7S50_04940 [bacterium]|nr:hypothetical protein [bacterium]